MSVDHEAEERAEQLAGAIYGTIVVAGLLAATGPDDDPEVLDTAFWVLATALVFWLAHSWALFLGRRAVHAGSRRTRFAHSLARNWPLVQSAFPPLGVMFVAYAITDNDRDAIEIASWACVMLLGGWGVVVARREHESLLRIAATALGCAALGALMVLLKIIIH